MIFESLWPLALLLSVPAVIILYLLKPKGKDYRNSSNLLWERMMKNQQSKTFLEKFVHNILMYLQILILILMVLALMSPYIRKEGLGKGHVVLVFDTSGSMQHDAGGGRSRLESALDEAKRLIAASEGTSFSVIANGNTTELLAVSVKDKASLYDVLGQVECCDGRGNLADAESVADTLIGADENTDGAHVIVFTDGSGAESAAGFADYFDAELRVIGEPVNNVANNFLSYVEDEEGCLAAASLTNYSGADADFELSLYEGGKLLQVKQAALKAEGTSLFYFDRFDWGGLPLKCEVSSVRFAGTNAKDSLAADNVSYAVMDQVGKIDAVLIGSGNTYLEKAYQAATGNSLTKAESGSDDAAAVHIYDAGAKYVDTAKSRMVFADGERAVDVKKNVMLSTVGCDLTEGMAEFAVGVNETKIYDVPEWGIGFLWAGEQCAGYYGDHGGVRVIAVGFDVRESDFPLKAEFPVFISNAIRFLGDSSLLADQIYESGEAVLFHPQPDIDVSALVADTTKAGLFEAGEGDWKEPYVVRFATGTESDGRLTAESSGGEGLSERVTVRKRVRSVILVMVLLLLIAEWLIYVRQTRGREPFYLGVRIALVVMLVLALCNVAIPRRESGNTTIFLVDLSNSNAQNLSLIEKEVGSALKKMPKHNRYGIVTFGNNSVVEQFLTDENHFTSIMSVPDKSATNYEEALSRALAMIPADGAGRVVILTDGKETKGTIAGTATALVSRKIELLAKTYEVTVGEDAYIDDVELPTYLYQGDAYTMTVTVESNYDTDAVISIWSGTIRSSAYDVHLNRGTNRFRFSQKVEGESVESFVVKVEAAGDTCAENDSFHAFSVVDSAPKVLLVSGMDEDSVQYERILQAANVNYRKVSAINAPDSLERLLEYRSVILENVYLFDLPQGFLENIDTYVKDYGCGVVCCGGERSYALGGYRDSVLETVLPVDMELRGVDEVPSTAMIMVIDHSGSMSAGAYGGATNLDLAITAATTAVDLMRSTDYVGVLTFDDRYSWVVEPTLCSDKESIKSKIETVADGGGTTIKPAVKEALRGVLTCDADVRHVILLSDGEGETRNFADVTKEYNDKGVTLSTVAVGQGSDTALLKQLAGACNGRYYYSDMSEDVPKIFAQEVFLSGDTYLQNGEFALAVNSGHEITRGIFERGWPIIYGYVSATPKPSAMQLIASEKDDPVLTVMQYGLGRTAAWNTDVTNEWTSGFAGLDDYVQLWKRVIDYTAGNAGIGDDTADVITAGGRTVISYRAKDYGETTRVEAVYTDPEGNTRTAELRATAPGQFEAKLDTDLTGVYNLSVRRIEDGEISNAITTAAVVQYSDEYRFGTGTAEFTRFIEQYGRMLKEDENFWQQRKSTARERYELAKWLLLLAILWFVMDIAVRRFCFLPQDSRLYRMMMQRIAQRKEKSAGEGVLARAGAAKETGEPTASGGEAAPGPAGAVSDLPAGEAAPASGKTGKKEKRPKKTGKQPPGGGAGQTLDTSALLKKKDQRSG
ncbi:MAG: VWA domain-containing protein [Agathobacter sp.]|nr:VWA domain-containing protein [Agathobacter sp.]